MQNDVRATLLQGLGGLAVLLGASFTYRQLRITREGQVTERFTRAIDQLGHENLDVRLGGIYALERIANDSSRDRATVAEVLTAFVRGHAPWPPTRPGQYVEDASIREIPVLRVRAPDVQAALTVLGRRKPSHGAEKPLDLTATDLRRADLTDAQLQGAIFDHAVLEGADLSGAQLQDAFLSIRLSLTFLAAAGMQRAHLDGADLRGAFLNGAQLQGADLGRADLRGAKLYRAQLQGADLDGAQLQGVDFTEANLQGASLSHRLGPAMADHATRWPPQFDWEAAGVELEMGD
jgi:hypothetical protein